MTPKFTSDKSLFHELEEITSRSAGEVKFLLLTKSDCYQLHRYISTDYDCVCEDLTWANGLVFNTDTFNHKDMYENLFKLEFKGVQLGQY